MWTVKKLKNRIEKHRLRYVHCAIFLFSFLFFAFANDRAGGPYAGETHYIGGGIEIFQHGLNTNWSQPPLGKILIGLGIKIFGGSIFATRLMSAIFGALTLNAMFMLGLIFFKSEWLAFVVVTVSFLNHFLFVLSRVADLEVFMFGFVAWGLVFFFQYSRSRNAKYLVASAVTLGLAMAVKWFAIVPIGLCALLFLTDNKNRRDSLVFWSCVLVAIASYFLTYSVLIGMKHPSWGGQLQVKIQEIETDPRPDGVPNYTTDGPEKEKKRALRKYVFTDFIQLQFEMYRALTKYNTPYKYTSEWYQWPIMYEFYPLLWRGGDSPNTFLGVILVGNPVILWFGFLSALLSFYVWLRYKNETAKIVTLLYFSLLLSWPLIPRNAYFLFYYFPAAMMLSLNIAFAFQFLKIAKRRQIIFLSACGLVFALFYPVLSGISVSTESLPYSLVLGLLGIIP